jgi:hypothetical protein
MGFHEVLARGSSTVIARENSGATPWQETLWENPVGSL